MANPKHFITFGGTLSHNDTNLAVFVDDVIVLSTGEANFLQKFIPQNNGEFPPNWVVEGDKYIDSPPSPVYEGSTLRKVSDEFCFMDKDRENSGEEKEYHLPPPTAEEVSGIVRPYTKCVRFDESGHVVMAFVTQRNNSSVLFCKGGINKIQVPTVIKSLFDLKGGKSKLKQIFDCAPGQFLIAHRAADPNKEFSEEPTLFAVYEKAIS